MCLYFRIVDVIHTELLRGKDGVFVGYKVLQETKAGLRTPIVCAKWKDGMNEAVRPITFSEAKKRLRKHPKEEGKIGSGAIHLF